VTASATKHGQLDLNEECPNDESYHYRDEESERHKVPRMPLEEMGRRDSEEGRPLHEQMAALEKEHREDILQIMREEMRWSDAVKKTNERKKGSSVATTRNMTMTLTRTASPGQTTTTRKGRR
jgi:hypothetical protein